MSGSSYEYAYRNLADLARMVRARAETELDVADHVRKLRHDFADRLELFARAAHAIEWADSGDTSEGSEVAAIRAALKGDVAPREPESLDALADAMARAGLGRDASFPDGSACFMTASLARVHVVVGTAGGAVWATVTVGATGAVATADATGPRIVQTVCAALRKVIIWCVQNDEQQAEDVLRRVLGEVARASKGAAV